jgi:hypothetical protein
LKSIIEFSLFRGGLIAVDTYRRNSSGCRCLGDLFKSLDSSNYKCLTPNSPSFLSSPTAALEEEQRNNANSNGTEKSELSTKQKHQMKHRELFLSRQVETLPATHIRGKCSVTLLNEEESLLSYLNKDVSAPYCLSFHS